MYTVTDLLTLGGPTSVPNAISQNGIIVGRRSIAAWELSVHLPGQRAHAKSRPPRSGERSHGERFVRELAGTGCRPGGCRGGKRHRCAHAFYYSGSGALVNLTPSSQQSVAWCINQSSQIVGGVQNASGTNDGMLWTIGGPTVDLGSAFLPRAINDEGEMGGLATQTQHAAIYSLSSGWITDLGTFGGAKSFIRRSATPGWQSVLPIRRRPPTPSRTTPTPEC